MDKVNEESILLTKQNYFARTNKIKQWLEVSNELIEKYDDVGSKIVVANYHRKNRNYKEAIKYYSLIAKDNIKYYSFCLEKICECFYHLRGYKSFKETLDILKNEDIDAYYYCSLNYLYLVTKEYDKAKNLIKKVVNSKRKRRNEIICTYIGFLYKDKNYKEAKNTFCY